MFTIKIRTTNDAFGDSEAEGKTARLMQQTQRDSELARILRDTADKLERGVIYEGSSATLYDVNGNDVGRALISRD